MVPSIVHSAITRKMLCDPVNSLIADTEFCCAAGMLLKIWKVGQAEKEKAQKQETVSALQSWLFTEYETELSRKFDIPIQRLIQMVKDYHAQDTPIDTRLKGLLDLGMEEEITYPKGKFL